MHAEFSWIKEEEINCNNTVTVCSGGCFLTGHLFLSECDRACHSRTLTAFGIELGRTKRYICALC